MFTFHWMQLVAVGAGGALGAMGRFWVSNQIYLWLGRDFAWGTLAVNVLGSFAIGLLMILMIDKFQASIEMRSFMIVGFLGAFTTFSTFSFETYLYLQTGEINKALLNIAISVITCIFAVWIGIWTGKQFITS